jgi:hypothetical protein
MTIATYEMNYYFVKVIYKLIEMNYYFVKIIYKLIKPKFLVPL